MRLVLTCGWILFALEALLVLRLALVRNMGDDAAGRGMATGFAMLLGPVVLGAGGLFAWGQMGGPAIALWVGFTIIAAPVVFLVRGQLGGSLRKLRRARARALHGRFDDPWLRRIVAALDRQDLAAMTELIHERRPDVAARDPWGHTLLGYAVWRALEHPGSSAHVAAARTLLAAGVPPQRDALAAEASMASVGQHELIYHVFGHPDAVDLLDCLLAAGASPHVTDEDGRPLWFSGYARRASVAVLARHGADVRALDNRSDQPGWTALMHYANLGDWPMAEFFLDQGVPVLHQAQDGASLASLLAAVPPPASDAEAPEDQAQRKVRAHLARALGASR